MTKEEIIPFADQATKANNRTEITFKDGSFIVGYFENNGDSKFRDTNHWNFVRTPIIDQNNEFSVLNGEDFKHINIIELR